MTRPPRGLRKPKRTAAGVGTTSLSGKDAHLKPQDYRDKPGRTLPELLTAVALLLIRQQSVTFWFCTLRGPSSKLPVSSFKSWKFGIRACSPPPAAWVKVFSGRFQLWQQQQLLQRPHLAVPPAFLAAFADQIVAAQSRVSPSVTVLQPVRLALQVRSRISRVNQPTGVRWKSMSGGRI